MSLKHFTLAGFLCSLFFCAPLLAADPEEPNAIQAQRIQQRPNIDGVLDDEAWKANVFFSGNFIQTAPNNGALSEQKTTIRIAYDDFAIYIAAKMYDNPDSILREFGIRDSGERNSDMFAVAFDTYNKQQNAFAFMVSAAGVQTDIFLTPSGDDTNWNAVWKSQVTIDKEGWNVEMEIPFSMLRFAKQEEQLWGINFLRVVKRKQEQGFWNRVDPNVNGFVNQFGKLKGIRNIEPPLRLQFTPYISSYLVHSTQNGFSSSVNGGMDLKFGINESYTLDMSLVPDFGQVVADNVVLNLTPFEVQFSENRPFFTEGTDLFNKGNLFYSRRVGQSFARSGEVMAQYLADNPGTSESQVEIVSIPNSGTPNAAPLMNATKISGRNKKGLGIGFFNALTNKTYATVRHRETGEESQVEADHLTNFNVFVIDQNLKNNSNISFINTNVTRFNGGRDANVTGTDFRFNDKNNTFGIRGFGAVNQIIAKEGSRRDTDVGYKYMLEVGKYSGTWQYGLIRNVESYNYNINDLGFLQAPNEITHIGWFSYNNFKPKGIFLRKFAQIRARQGNLHRPNVYSTADLTLNGNMQFKNFWEVGSFMQYNFTSHDYFEPRTSDFSIFFKKAGSIVNDYWVSTDSRKRFQVTAYAGWWTRPSWNQFDNWLGLFPRFRVNNRLSFDHGIEATFIRREIGYIWDVPADVNPNERIPMGERYRLNLTNTLSGSYIFNNMMGISLRVRHYWGKADYTDKFFFLKQNGDLERIEGYGGENNGDPIHDANFNAFNVDLVYSWQFAPGSMMTVVWKDAIVDYNNNAQKSFGRNLSDVLSGPQTNSLSVRILYFLDYLDIKKAFRGRSGNARNDAFGMDMPPAQRIIEARLMR